MKVLKAYLYVLRSDTKPLPWLLADPQRSSGFMAVLQGSDTIMCVQYWCNSAQNCALTRSPSSLLDGIYHFRTNVMIRNDELELLRITASKHPTLFATATQTRLLMWVILSNFSEASMGDCWNVSISSTSSSKSKLQLDYKDPSKNPVHDLRCLEVIEWIDRRTSVLVIIMGKADILY